MKVISLHLDFVKWTYWTRLDLKVFTDAKMLIVVLWIVTPCSRLQIFRRNMSPSSSRLYFRQVCCLLCLSQVRINWFSWFHIYILRYIENIWFIQNLKKKHTLTSSIKKELFHTKICAICEFICEFVQRGFTKRTFEGRIPRAGWGFSRFGGRTLTLMKYFSWCYNSKHVFHYGFKSWPWHRISWLRCTVVFLNPSTQMPG
jgi:hypothetical protein